MNQTGKAAFGVRYLSVSRRNPTPKCQELQFLEWPAPKVSQPPIDPDIKIPDFTARCIKRLEQTHWLLFKYRAICQSELERKIPKEKKLFFHPSILKWCNAAGCPSTFSSSFSPVLLPLPWPVGQSGCMMAFGGSAESGGSGTNRLKRRLSAGLREGLERRNKPRVFC